METDNPRGKRRTAHLCLIYLLVISIAGWWFPPAYEQFKFVLPIVLPFVAYLYGADVYSHVSRYRSDRSGMYGGGSGGRGSGSSFGGYGSSYPRSSNREDQYQTERRESGVTSYQSPSRGEQPTGVHGDDEPGRSESRTGGERDS